MLQGQVVSLPSSQIEQTQEKFLSIELKSEKDKEAINKNTSSFKELLIAKELFSENLLQGLQVNRVIIDFKENGENAEHIYATCIAYGFFPFTQNLPSAAPFQQVEFYRGEITVKDKDAETFLKERTKGDLL